MTEAMPISEAIAVYNSEMRAKSTGEDAWQKDIVVVPKSAMNDPGASDIGYAAFLAALVKLTIVSHETTLKR